MALLFGLVQAEAKGSSGDALSYEIEGAGTGSRYAVPIAEKMFREYLGD